MTFSNKKIKKVLDFINSDVNKHIYICNNSFIYVYSDHFILGLDINDFEFVGEKEILFKVINNGLNKVFVKNDFIDTDLYRLLSDNKIITPYLHYLIYGK